MAKKQTQGWLDKYDGGGMQEYQENYNDASASYPPGFVGMGYDTTGRDYSPAWGGQFKDGGKKKKKKETKTIDTSNTVVIDGKKYDRSTEEYKDLYRFGPGSKGGGGIGYYDEQGNLVSSHSTRPEVVIFKKDKDTQTFYDDLSDENQYAFGQLTKKYGPVNITKNEGTGIFKNTAGHYNPLNNTITISPKSNDPVDTYIAELSHKLQFDKRGKLSGAAKWLGNDLSDHIKYQYHNLKENYNIGDSGKNFENIVNSDPYSDPNSLEYEAHSIIEPKLQDEFNDYRYDDILEKNYNKFEMGGSLPGATGFTYARTQGIPSNGKYAKKTKASAENGHEMSYYQHGLDFKTKGMKDGGWLDKYETPQAQPGTKVTQSQSRFHPEWYEEGINPEEDNSSYNNPSPSFTVSREQFINNLKKQGLYPVTFNTSKGKEKKVIANKSNDATQSTDVTVPSSVTPHQKFINDLQQQINNSVDPAIFNNADSKWKQQPYEPTQSVKNAKAALTATSLGAYYGGNPLLGFYSGVANATGDAYTAARYAMDGQWKNAAIDAGEAVVDLLPFAKGKSVINLSKNATPTPNKFTTLEKLYNNTIKTLRGAANLDNLLGAKPESGGLPVLVKHEKGGVVKDDMGYWNPDNHGKVVEIGSNNITMQGVDQDLIGISDEGDMQYMTPGNDYKFKGKKVREYPVAKNGVRQEQKGLKNLDQLTNFTNYNKPTSGGWLDKYN